MEKKKKSLQKVSLPRIKMKHQNTTMSMNSSSINTTSRYGLQCLLQQVRLKQLGLKKYQSHQMQAGYKRMELSQRFYVETAKQQIKKNNFKENSLIVNDEENRQIQPIFSVKTIQTKMKPPHRYKAAIIMHEDMVIIYGGLGCQKNISWAKLQLKTLNWTISTNEQYRQVSLYGHSMGLYKGIAYVYGGSRMDSTINQLTKIDLKTMGQNQINPAPFRRKQHAMTFLTKHMIIHGGIQNGREVKNNLFYFDAESGNWSSPAQHLMPYLSHHSMVAVPIKYKRKISTFFDLIGQSIYMFGGKDEKGLVSNKFLKLKIENEHHITTEEIVTIGGPEARHSFCMQFVYPSFICIYGGKNEEQCLSTNQIKGIYNDIFLYCIQRKKWIVPFLRNELNYRFGVSSFSFKNKIILFGGTQLNEYADGNIIQLTLYNQGQNQILEDEHEEENVLRSRLRG